jgi:hypothetical protein
MRQVSSRVRHLFGAFFFTLFVRIPVWLIYQNKIYLYLLGSPLISLDELIERSWSYSQVHLFVAERVTFGVTGFLLNNPETSSAGVVNFQDVLPGSYVMQVTKMGYATQTVNVIVAAGVIVQPSVTMQTESGGDSGLPI